MNGVIKQKFFAVSVSILSLSISASAFAGPFDNGSYSWGNGAGNTNGNGNSNGTGSGWSTIPGFGNGTQPCVNNNPWGTPNTGGVGGSAPPIFWGPGPLAVTTPNPSPSAEPSPQPSSQPLPICDPNNTGGWPGTSNDPWTDPGTGFGYPGYTDPNSPIGQIDGAITILDKIVNLGKTTWDFVKANKPVVNVQADMASALPAGAMDWTDLQGWQKPVSKLYRVQIPNPSGKIVIDFSFRVVFSWGGNVDGKGHYLAQIQVIPADIVAKWGEQFDARITIPSITNAGTKDDPIAAAVVQVQWLQGKVTRARMGSATFYVRGDGTIQDISSPNDDEPEVVHPIGKGVRK